MEDTDDDDNVVVDDGCGGRRRVAAAAVGGGGGDGGGVGVSCVTFSPEGIRGRFNGESSPFFIMTAWRRFIPWLFLRTGRFFERDEDMFCLG